MYENHGYNQPYPYNTTNDPYQLYPPPYVIVQTPIQDNGIPVVPLYEEKRWIKRFYNWTGACLLIHFGISAVLSIAILLIGIIIIMHSSYDNTFNQLVKKYLLGKDGFSFLSILASAIGYGTANIVAFIIGCKKTAIKPKALVKFSGFSAKLLFSAIALALAIQTIISFIIIMVRSISETGIIPSSYVESARPGSATLIVTILYVCIIAPITEELVFRGLCLKNLSRFNQRFGIIASSIIFGLVHGNIIQFLLASSMGIVLSYITIKANSIIPAIIVHFTVNTTSIIRDLISQADFQIGSAVDSIWYIVTLAVGIPVLILVLTKYKIRLPKQSFPQKVRGLPLFMSSAPMVVIISIYAAIIILPLLGLPLIFLFNH